MHVRFLKLIALLAVASLVFAACGGGDDTDTDAGGDDQAQEEPADTPEDDKEDAEGEGGEATFTAVDFGFQGPDSLPAGKVQVTLNNEGTELHEMAIIGLEQGKTLADVLSFVKEQGTEGKPPSWAKFAGGIKPVKPGDTGQGGANLQPGAYALLCFIESKKNGGQPHVALGMAAPLVVQ